MAGFQTVGQCEWADYPTKVLEKHWPDVPRWRDIRTLTADTFREEIYMANHRKDYDAAVEMYNMGMSVEEIADEIGADSLAYLSVDAAHRLAGDRFCPFCDGCFTGHYPVSIPESQGKSKFEQPLPESED